VIPTAAAADDESADDEATDDEATADEAADDEATDDEAADEAADDAATDEGTDDAATDDAATDDAATDDAATDETGDPTDDGSAAAIVPPQPFGLSVGPGRYEVVDLGAEDRIPPGVPHTTIVRSTNGVGVVAERVTVDRSPVPERRSRRAEPQPRRSEISATTGSRLAAPVWRFLSLGDPDDDTSTVTVVVYNPDPTTAVDVLLDLVPRSPADDASPDDDATRDDDATQDDEAGDDDTQAGGDETSGVQARSGAAIGDDGAAGNEPGDGLTAPVSVPPGGRVVIELDAAQAAAADSAIVHADGPVVVDRVLRLGDGRRRSFGGGVPAAAGAIPLDRLADDGRLDLPG
jgi:hypothetical protein